MQTVVDTFEPADFSLEELAFLRDHLSESPTGALHDGTPKGVNKTAITAALSRFRELDELKTARNVPWAGYEPIKESIDRFIAYQEKCMAAQQFGEPRHPSQHIWDSTGSKIDQGIGSDASEKVRNELLEDGSRIPFAVKLIGGKRRSKVWGQPKTAITTADDKITHENGIVFCTICNKPITSYDVTTASSRIKNKHIKLGRDHCMKSQTEIARHRAIANVPVA